MSLPKVNSGARAILKIDGNLMAFATSVSYTIDTTYKEIQGVDNSLPDELVPETIRVELTCTNLRVPKESASVLALQPTILNHLHQKYLSVEIRDRGTDDVLLYIPKALLVQRSGVIGSRALANETWVLKGIGYWDERPPEKAKEGATSSLIGGVSDLARKIRNPLE